METPNIEIDGVRPARRHRAGVVALLGPPNAGKSTLLNALLGQKLAIVTAKPQTTRSRILGVLPYQGPDFDAQLAFCDTPGRHDSARRLNRALNESVCEAVKGCDVGALLVDATRGWSEIHDSLAEDLARAGARVVWVATKLDLLAPELRRRGVSPWPPEPARADAAVSVSANTREGLGELVSTLAGLMPESPPLYPGGELTDRPLRWIAAEWIREAVFEALSQELPYEVAVQVVEFDESRPALVRIRAEILVVRDSQKRIVVGSGGEMIKSIGVRARTALEDLVERQVHLDLRVKVDPSWAKSPERLRRLGYV